MPRTSGDTTKSPQNFFNYRLQKFLSSAHPEWQSGSDSTAARRGHSEQGGGRLGCVKHEKKEVKYGGRLFLSVGCEDGGQGGEPAAGGLNDSVLVERSLIQHLQSPRLLLLFFLLSKLISSSFQEWMVTGRWRSFLPHPLRQTQHAQIGLKSASLWGFLIQWLSELAADCVGSDFTAV